MIMFCMRQEACERIRQRVYIRSEVFGKGWMKYSECKSVLNVPMELIVCGLFVAHFVAQENAYSL